MVNLTNLRSYCDWLLRLPVRPRQDEFEFTTDWFSNSRDAAWVALLAPLRGRANLKYLEVGVYEGRSLLWVLENILTHPTSRAYAVDPLLPPYNARLRENLRRSAHGKRVHLLGGWSGSILRTLPACHFDFVYIDGAHDARSVLSDAVNAWYILKPGGLLIFDDYQIHEGRMPEDLVPTRVLDTFVAAMGSDIEVLFKGYQLIVRKKVEATMRVPNQTQFADYYYDWYRAQLFRRRSLPKFLLRRLRPMINGPNKIWSHLYSKFLLEPVPLSDKDNVLLEALLRAIVNGANELVVPPDFMDRVGAERLCKFLDVRLNH